MDHEPQHGRIDVVTIGTLRPDILEFTLLSFHRKFLRQFQRARLIINIDPIGDERRSTDDVLRICAKYFSEITHRCPDQPHFATAVKWAWEQVETEIFLHLEDDWLLKRKVDATRIVRGFEADPDLASLRFNLTRNPSRGPLYFQGPSLNPSVIRRRFLEEVLPFFSPHLDPEKQYTYPNDARREVLAHWRHMLYGEPGEASYVLDIGKKWRRFHGFAKWQPGSGELSWRKTPVPPLRKTWYALKHAAFSRYLQYLAGRG